MGTAKYAFTFYINKQTRVELTETTLSTSTTWLWLYTNRRCCTVGRSGVGGLGGARATGNGSECNMVTDWLKKPEPDGMQHGR